jgi:cobalt-zinc-cadmium efflux system outer membrane protein
MRSGESGLKSCGAALLAALVLARLAGVAFAGEDLSLSAALRLALENNPELLAARQELGVARGRLTKSRYWNQFNPEVGGQGGRREFAGGGAAGEFAVSGSQEIEVAGQRGRRIDEAERNAERVAALVRDRERRLEGDVTRAFFSALAARRRLALQRMIEELNQRTLDATSARVKAGESPQMEANLAEIRFGQSRRETIAAETEVATTVLQLKRLLGLPPERVVEPSGELRGTARALAPPDAVARALAQRPDLLAAQAELARVRAELALVRRLRIPNPTLEGFYETEAEGDGGRDRIVGGGLRIPLPVFDRNQGEVMALAAQEQQARHLLNATRRTVEQEVTEALREYEAAGRALEVLEARVLDPVRENLGFIETAYREGKIDLLQFVVVQNDLVRAEFTYLDSLAAFRRAEANLAAAIGGQLMDGDVR